MSTSGTARNDGSQNIHFIGRTIAYNTAGIGTADTVKIGSIPAGSKLAPTQVHVTAAFNAVTTNVLTVGTTSANTNVVAAAEVNEGAIGTTIVATGCDLSFTSDTDIYVRYTQTGTAATTGAATILIPYFPPNW